MIGSPPVVETGVASYSQGNSLKRECVYVRQEGQRCVCVCVRLRIREKHGSFTLPALRIQSADGVQGVMGARDYSTLFMVLFSVEGKKQK